MKIKRIVFITAIILAFQILSFTNSTEIYADNSDINNAATGEDVINVDNVAPSSPNSSIYNINEDISLITAAPEVPRNVTAHPSGSSIVISWDTNNDNSYYDLKINDILVTEINTNSYIFNCEDEPEESYTIQVRSNSFSTITESNLSSTPLAIASKDSNLESSKWSESLTVTMQISVGGTLTEDTVFTLENSPYILSSPLIIPAGITLTVEPGTEIRCSTARTANGSIIVNGTLLAEGNAELPILFTALADWAPNFYWSGITVGDTGEFRGDYVQIKNAGRYQSDRYYPCYSIAVYNLLNLTNSEISNSNSGGVLLNTNAVAIINNNSIVNNKSHSIEIVKCPNIELKDNFISSTAGYGVYIHSSSTMDAKIEGNQISASGTGGIGIKIESYPSGSMFLESNILGGATDSIFVNFAAFSMTGYETNTYNGMQYFSGSFPTSMTLGKNSYYFSTVVIPTGVTLTVAPGTEIRCSTARTADGSIIVNGTLLAEGTAELPILFTASADSAPNGYWSGITVGNAGEFRGDYVQIKNAGRYQSDKYYPCNSIKVLNLLHLTNSEISNSNSGGIYLNTTRPITIKYNSLMINNGYALYNNIPSTITMDAKNNYWGSADGPSIYVQDPITGSWYWTSAGGKISNGINYLPYLDRPMSYTTATVSYVTSDNTTDSVTARVAVNNNDSTLSRNYYAEVYCSWDEEKWYYKGGSEVTIPEGATVSYVDLEFSIYKTGNLHSKVVIYDDGGSALLGEYIKSATDYVAAWYHFTIQNPDTTIEQYVSSVEDISNPVYLISKQSDEELWKQYVLDGDTWTDTGITYDLEPFTENWVLNNGSQSPLKNNLSIQALNTNGLLNVVHITKTSTQIASEIIEDNAQYILDAGIEYSVDSKIVAGVIYTEQSLNVNVFDSADYIVAFYGILDTSIGIGQVKMTTAKMLEDEEYVPKASASDGGWNIPFIGFIHGTETMARAKRLENNQQNIIYVAACLKYWQDVWEDEYPQINEDPAILGTLYNLGTHANAPNPDPQSNQFGDYVEENYDYMGDLLGLGEI